MTKRDMGRALQRAIKAAGGGTAVAKAVKKTRQTVFNWEITPGKHVLALEEACGGAVSRHDLRPDLYPKPEQEKVHGRKKGR